MNQASFNEMAGRLMVHSIIRSGRGKKACVQALRRYSLLYEGGYAARFMRQVLILCGN